MSSLESRLEDLRDRIAFAQATIDQARAHFADNSHLFTEEMRECFSRDLDEKQAYLDRQKLIMTREFPK